MLTAAPSLEFAAPRDIHAAARGASPEHVSWLTLPETRYLAIDGTGQPADEDFRAAISTLYPVAYTLHFALRRLGVDAPVGALEGIYGGFDADDDLSGVLTGNAPPPAGWRWRLLLPVPDQATDADIAAAIEDVRRKGKATALGLLRVERIPPTRVAQILHVGPYDAEAPTVRHLLDAIAAAGLQPDGGHHEIYISDPNRTPAARLKTVIRMNVRAPAEG